MAEGGYQNKFHGIQGDTQFHIGWDANGLDAIIASGSAAADGDIVTDIGVDSLFADGSLYISVVDGAGKLFQKQNDVWIDLQAAL